MRWTNEGPAGGQLERNGERFDAATPRSLPPADLITFAVRQRALQSRWQHCAPAAVDVSDHDDTGRQAATLAYRKEDFTASALPGVDDAVESRTGGFV